MARILDFRRSAGSGQETGEWLSQGKKDEEEARKKTKKQTAVEKKEAAAAAAPGRSARECIKQSKLYACCFHACGNPDCSATYMGDKCLLKHINSGRHYGGCFRPYQASEKSARPHTSTQQ